jgi:hypothetical protein
MRENNFAPSMLIGNSRAGQKGTLGLIIPEEDMPFTADGLRPDLIINPHALPSRMTIGQLVESLFGKACCLYGGYGDCTAFATKGANYDTYGPMLTKMGYHNSGNQILYNGYTGEQLYSEIFVGPTYYMRLKHMVKDKINYRATGKRNFLTRQTNQGRANDGGLKIGEMERDGIMAHGLSYFLNESYMVRGDQYYMAICNKTGSIAVYNPDKNLFLSPFADGPLVFNRNVEGQEILDAISKFGRSFSLVRVPFALKLLIQELQVMNIQMRIITEDNIDQLTNLSFQSRNIDKLLHIDHGSDGQIERDIKEIVENYKQTMETKFRRADIDKKKYDNKNEELNLNLKFASNEPIDNDNSLDMQQSTIIPVENAELQQYNPESLSYNPESQYAPYSPAYNSESLPEPQYAPYSPAYQSPSSENTVGGGLRLRGGSMNVFPNDPNMNAAFNMLEGESQAQILQMPQDQRGVVMGQIMLKSARQSQSQSQSPTQPQRQYQMQTGVNAYENNSDMSPLIPYFTKLPLEKQAQALHGGYSSMSKEFNNLAKKVELQDPLITLKTPVSMQDQLADKFPMISVKTNKPTTTTTTTTTVKSDDTTSSTSSSSDDNSNSSSSDSSIRKIKF